MIDFIKNMEFEYKAAFLMGFGALVISVLIGIVSGVSFGVLAIRSVIVFPVFAGIGFGVSVVLKQFVPELYEILNFEGDESIPDVGMREDGLDDEMKTAEELEGSSQKVSDSSFQEFSKSDFPKADESKNQAEDNDLNASLEAGAIFNKSGRNAGDGNLGKHIVMSESFGKYEPKVMAQAIRTMLKREGD